MAAIVLASLASAAFAGGHVPPPAAWRAAGAGQAWGRLHPSVQPPLTLAMCDSAEAEEAAAAASAIAAAANSSGNASALAEAPKTKGASGAGVLWSRVRRRFRRKRDETADDGAAAELTVIDAELLEGVAEDIEVAIAARRRRLNTRLATSLRTFREDILDEVGMQERAVRERQDRLKQRQSLLLSSLSGLRDDLMEDVETLLAQVQEGGKRVEKSIRTLRKEWEAEVEQLVKDAKTDVDLATSDIEEALAEQREEWKRSVALFNEQWLRPWRAEEGGAALGGSFPPLAGIGVGVGVGGGGVGGGLGEMRRRLAEVQESIAEINDNVEADIADFKRRWNVTAARLEELPTELPKLKTLADVRMYVADTIFAGDVPALLRTRKPALKPADAAAAAASTAAADIDRASAGAVDVGVAAFGDGEAAGAVLTPTAASNLRAPGRQLAIFTTAALPWMTGTSVNPLLRAAHLARKGYNVTLLVPWLPPAEQPTLFPKGLLFDRPSQQEAYARWWLLNRANLDVPQLRIMWFPAQYESALGCIIQKEVDLASMLPAEERDVVILEEPEHINWYHHGAQWSTAFQHVVGVAHTNYLQYARLSSDGAVPGPVKEKWTQLMNNVVCAAHTDVVVKLSGTLQDVPGHNLVCNVHGVRSEFLAIGAEQATRAKFDQGAYFLGKALWTKGYRELIDVLEAEKARSGVEALPSLHTYGSGPDSAAIKATIKSKCLPVLVNDGIDHAHPSLHGYAVFINPSTSDVLCTATAEALAMGKKVIIPDHISNTFFKQFANTLTYDHTEEVVPLLVEALKTPPIPMSRMEQYALSWEAATERLLDAAALPKGTKRPKERPMHQLAYWTHYAMGVQPAYDVLRTVTGATPVTPWRERLQPRRRDKRGPHSLELPMLRRGRGLLKRKLLHRQQPLSKLSSLLLRAHAPTEAEADALRHNESAAADAALTKPAPPEREGGAAEGVVQ